MAAAFFWIRNLRVVFLRPGSVDEVIATFKKNIQDTGKIINDFESKYIPLKNNLKVTVPALINQAINSTSTPLTNQ